LQDLTDGNISSHWIAVDTTSPVQSAGVNNSQNWVATEVFAKLSGQLEITEGVDEYRNELLGARDHFGVTQRTAGELLATVSARVLTKVNPHQLAFFLGLSPCLLIVGLPQDSPDWDVGKGGCR
jgi:hypothetical protein